MYLDGENMPMLKQINSHKFVILNCLASYVYTFLHFGGGMKPALLAGLLCI
jgi:hypothetical protein